MNTIPGFMRSLIASSTSCGGVTRSTTEVLGFTGAAAGIKTARLPGEAFLVSALEDEHMGPERLRRIGDGGGALRDDLAVLQDVDRLVGAGNQDGRDRVGLGEFRLRLLATLASSCLAFAPRVGPGSKTDAGWVWSFAMITGVPIWVMS